MTNKFKLASRINFLRPAFFAFLVLFGVMHRYFDYPPNFSPIAAIALFSGFYTRKYWSFFIPIAILFLSDILFLGTYKIEIMFSVYFSLGAVSAIGILISRKKSLLNIFFGAFLGALLFFLVTNFSVWYFGNWYEHNLAGLARCFFLAIPFFKNSLMGDIFFTSIFFGIYELASHFSKKTNGLNSNLKKYA